MTPTNVDPLLREPRYRTRVTYEIALVNEGGELVGFINEHRMFVHSLHSSAGCENKQTMEKVMKSAAARKFCGPHRKLKLVRRLFHAEIIA